SHADRKGVKRFGPSVPEDEGRVEGLKSSSAPEKKGQGAFKCLREEAPPGEEDFHS
ncbi:hypothetical protein KUCAC02_015959, partial [Chaenocephalus aceratus]